MRIDDELAEQARKTDLPAYLMSIGEKVKREGAEYTLEDHDSLKMAGNRWYWNKKGTSGNTLEFLMNEMGIPFREAVQKLTSAKLEEITYVPKSTAPIEKAPNEKRVIAYLCKRRCLDSEIILPFISQGIIAQDTHGNCNFIISDWNEQPMGAEIVGTGDTRFKNITSHSGYGFHITMGEPTHALFFESAIDLLSFYQIYQPRITNHILISMGGLNTSVICELKKQKPDIKNYVLCVDNDDAGHNFICKVMDIYPETKFYLPKNPYKDWNDVLQGKQN